MGRRLVKTCKFKKPVYVGDPINAVHIFNEKEVDEIAVIEISRKGTTNRPDFMYLAEIAGEAFMPLSYGGGIRAIGDAERILSSGSEKVILNTAAFQTPELVTELANRFGSQSVVVSLDVKRNWFRSPEVFMSNARSRTRMTPTSAARHMENLGAGELIFHDVDREGTYRGFDVSLLKSVVDEVTVPVVALGGAGRLTDLADAVRLGGASAVSAGSLFVFQGPRHAVLITYPAKSDLERAFSSHMVRE
ncbi:MAG: imidazole glycerol phosphate synthase subunit HisF [Planctomycetes bacterium]|nr:imidazole glycerol phosphate synthase subunit HisF [Planctomycetota bacterium]